MSTGNYKFQCPLCRAKTLAVFKIPRLFEPTKVRLNCSECESELLATLKKTQKSKQVHYDPLRMDIAVSVIRESEQQRLVREDQAKFNASELSSDVS